MKKIAVAVFALSFALVGCTVQTGSTEDTVLVEDITITIEETASYEVAEEPVATLSPLTVAILPSLDSLPIFIADEMGFFEDRGLTVNVERFTSARDRDIAFQSSDDFHGLVFDVLALGIYQQAGVDLVAVVSSTGLAALIGTPGVYTLDDIEGTTIIISRNTAMDFILHSALIAAGLEPEDIVIDEVPSLPTRLEFLLEGHAQAATFSEPFATIAVDAGLHRIVTTRDLGINPFVYGFRREIVEEKTDEVRAFLYAINDSINFLNTADREDFIDLLIDVVGYPEDTRDTLVLPEFAPLVTPTIENVQEVLDFAILRDIIQTPINAEDVIFDVLGN